jgi:hypothetical protein
MTAQPAKRLEDNTEGEGEADIPAKNDPTWFSGTYGEATPEDLAERYAQSTPTPITVGQSAAYAAYQKRLEERFGMAQRLADPEAFARRAAPEPTPRFPQRPYYAQAMQTPAPKPKLVLGVRPATIAILTLTACALGGAGGYGVANPGQVKTLASSLWFTPTVTFQETVIPKKTLNTAKLEVKDIEGAVNSPIALDIAATPANADTPVALRISGLPDAAYLTKGTQIAAGEWMLKAEDLAQAELVVPHTSAPQIALEVAALEAATGLPAAPSQAMNVTLDMAAVPVPGVPQPKSDPQPIADDVRVVPVAAEADQGFNKAQLPPAVPLPLESLNPEVRGLMEKGNGLLANGDVLAARQFYLKAFGLNAPEAAFGVGQTYDPSVYAQHKIKGLAADPKAAAEWYGKAAAAGFESAQAAIAQLPMQP